MSGNTISVVGLGYIGLPTAAVFASRKKRVIGVDINRSIVDCVNKGDIHIVEPDLDVLVKSAVKDGFLRCTTSPEQADVFLIAVPTPFIPSKSENSHPVPDLTFIESAARAIAKVLKKGDLVILESTSPVGTTQKIAVWLEEDRGDLTFPQTHGDMSDIRIAYCPERVLPGNVLRELIENDRVIGGMTDNCSKAAIDVYKIFVKGNFSVTNAKTAEMSKLTENSFRDTNIAFANELSMICDKIDIDVWELIRLANLHPRVNILQPGPGVGGHCIAVDPWFIVNSAPEDSELIIQARKTNIKKTDWVLNKITLILDEHLRNRSSKRSKEVNIACYGITFKPDIDDMRESPAKSIISRLRDMVDSEILLVEPNVSYLPEGFHGVRLVSLIEASQCDIHVMLVDHKEFKLLKRPIGDVIDICGVWTSNGVDF